MPRDGHFWYVEVQMHTVFKNMDEFYERAGAHVENSEKSKQCIKEFKALFWDTYKKYICLIKEFQIDVSDKIKKITNKDFKCGLSEQLLLQALIDAYDDLFRLTDFHPTKTPNSLKEISYIAYWLIRRKPLIVPVEYEDLITIDSKDLKTRGRMHVLFMNEFFASNLLINTVFNKGKVVFEVDEKELELASKQLEIFQGFLFYTLVYRVDTPKYIEAVMLACTIHPIWEVDPEVWQIIEKELGQ